MRAELLIGQILNTSEGLVTSIATSKIVSPVVDNKGGDEPIIDDNSYILASTKFILSSDQSTYFIYDNDKQILENSLSNQE